MILWFLRLFSEFRKMESMLAESQSSYERISGAYGALVKAQADLADSVNINTELTTRNAILQDRLDAQSHDRTLLWETMQEALRGERTAYQFHVNATTQKAGGGTPYPDAPSLAENAVTHQDTSPIPRKLFPGEAAKMKTEKFIREYGTAVMANVR